MKTPARNAVSRRSVNDRTGARHLASRLTVSILRIPRHTASAAMLTALAGIAHAGTVAATEPRAEAACRPMACITHVEIRPAFQQAEPFHGTDPVTGFVRWSGQAIA